MTRASCGHDAPAHARGLCRRCYDARRSGGPAPKVETGVRPAILDELRSYVHPAPFGVTYPRVPVPEDGDIVTGIIYGDTHGQFIDPEAEAILFGVVRDFRPDVLVHVGDAVDCYSISDYDRDPLRKETLQDEIDEARRHLARARAVHSGAFFLLEGNHEDRLRRAIWRAEGPVRELMQLREIQRAISWPTLLQLDPLGVEFVPLTEQPKRDIFPKFILKHGEVVRKWGARSAQGEWERYGKSGASGHVHRLGLFFHRDWNGNHVWAETGCLCRLDPDYVRDPDWQQGFVVVSFERTTGAFHLEPVYIHRGRAVWRGKVYVS